MLLRALRPFTSHPDVVQVVVVVPAGFDARPPEWLGKLVGDRLGLVAGGGTRGPTGRARPRGLPPHRAVVLVPHAAPPVAAPGAIDGGGGQARLGGGARA